MSTVPVSGTSHLRGLCGMGGPRTVVAGSSDAAQKAVRVRRGGAGGEGVASGWAWLGRGSREAG